MSIRPKEKFLDGVSDIGEHLFQEVFTDRTISRQAYLIGFSLVTILLSYSLLSPLHFSFLGMRFKQENINNVSLIFAICTFYTLIVYLISLYRDWCLYEYKKQRAVSIAVEIARENIISINEREAEIKKYHSERGKIFREKLELFDLHSEVSKIYNEKLDSLHIQHKEFAENAKFHETMLVYAKFQEVSKKYKEELEAYKELLNEIGKEGNESEIAGLIKELQNKRDAMEEVDRIETLAGTLRKNQRVLKVSLFFELLVPYAIGITAIYIAQMK